jgi:hypothetical protein
MEISGHVHTTADLLQGNYTPLAMGWEAWWVRAHHRTEMYSIGTAIMKAGILMKR